MPQDALLFFFFLFSSSSYFIPDACLSGPSSRLNPCIALDNLVFSQVAIDLGWRRVPRQILGQLDFSSLVCRKVTRLVLPSLPVHVPNTNSVKP